MDEHMSQTFNEALTEVMNRFRNFFIGPGINMREENVPFRQRPDFPAPLVTVMGHTYGLRLVEEPAKSGKKTKGGEGHRCAVEVSVNIYSNEFQIDRFKRRLAEEYKPEKVAKTIRNFMTPRDTIYLEDHSPMLFSEFFGFDLEKDLQIIKKEKQTASKITGKLVDTILIMRYWVQKDACTTFMKDPKLFASAVYLSCLRVFTIAYRKSLTLHERRLLTRR